MPNWKNTIQTRPLFAWLLPVFFVWHGFTGNFGFIAWKDAGILLAIYLGFTLLFFGLAYWLYRNVIKAALLATCLMAFHFFFGSIQDGLKNVFPDSLPSRYSFILPAALLILISIIILLKKRKKTLYNLTRFLNILLLLLILLDTIMVIPVKSARTGNLPAGLTACDTCARPDIYFILADEYAGNTELKDLFGFDDSIFIQQLQQRNFHVLPESYSNYNYTPFAVASMLNMDYLNLAGKDRGKSDLTYCYETIRDNRFGQFLQSAGYDFYNYSVFDFKGQPARTLETFLPANTRLITSQTLLSRLNRDLRFNLVTRFKSKKDIRAYTYANRDNNQHLYSLTMKKAEQKSTRPKFVYTHLMLPHYPYFYNSKGQEQPFDSLQEGRQTNRQLYIEYLQYANTELLKLIDHILKQSSKPPVIILMGDHGFRHFGVPVDQKYYFLNLASVHLPSGNYRGFSDSLGGVNMLRVLLNTEFNQHLPLLKDSVTYLKD